MKDIGIAVDGMCKCKINQRKTKITNFGECWMINMLQTLKSKGLKGDHTHGKSEILNTSQTEQIQIKVVNGD